LEFDMFHSGPIGWKRWMHGHWLGEGPMPASDRRVMIITAILDKYWSA